VAAIDSAGTKVTLSAAVTKPIKEEDLLKFSSATLCGGSGDMAGKPADQCSADPAIKTKAALFQVFPLLRSWP
jgi:hypothetical protein